MDIDEIKKTYPIQKDVLELLGQTKELRDKISVFLDKEEKRLKEQDLWDLKDELPYNRMFNAFWSLNDAITEEIHYAAERFKEDMTDDLIDKLT